MSHQAYASFKFALIVVSIYLFFNPSVFAPQGYGLSIESYAVCRVLSLMMALYISSTLIDHLYNQINKSK